MEKIDSFCNWLINDVGSAALTAAKYKYMVAAVRNMALEKTGEASGRTNELELIIAALDINEGHGLSASERRALAYYIGFIIIYNNLYHVVESSQLDKPLYPSEHQFRKWLHNGLGYSVAAIDQHIERLSLIFNNQNAYDGILFKETDLRTFMEFYSHKFQDASIGDRKLLMNYLSYLATLLSSQDDQTGKCNGIVFEEWMRERHASRSLYYDGLLQDISKKCLEESGISITSPEIQAGAAYGILFTLIRKNNLSRQERKTAAFYVSYLLQRAETIESEANVNSQRISATKKDFENWMSFFMGISRHNAIQTTQYMEEINDIFSCLGLSIYQTESLPELFSAIKNAKSELAKRHIIAFDYYCAYLVSLLPESGEDCHGFPQQSKNTAEDNLMADYGIWSLKKGYSQATIQAQGRFHHTLAQYCSNGGDMDLFMKKPPIEQLEEVLDIYTREESYGGFLTKQKHYNYTDRFCLYLIDRCPEDKIKGLLSSYVEKRPLPILVLNHKRVVSAKFCKWLKENGFCEDNSARTYVSSLYSIEDIARDVYNESIFHTCSKRKISYLALILSENPGFKNDYLRPLRLYMQFLSSYQLISQEGHQQDAQRIVDIINRHLGGRINISEARDYERLQMEWRNETAKEFTYTAEQLTSILEAQSIYDAGTGIYITPAAFAPCEARHKLLEFIHSSFETGHSIVEYQTLLGFIPHAGAEHKVETLKQYLGLICDNTYVCESKFLRNIGESRKARSVAELICDTLREIGRPVPKDELKKHLPTLSEESIQKTLHRNGINMTGIINPKRGGIFHADIIKLSDSENQDIIAFIDESLKRNHYVTSGQLFQRIQENNGGLLKKYPFLNQDVLYRVLRYKLGGVFQFNLSFVTLSGTVDVPSLFHEFCQQREMFNLSDLEGLETDLGKVGIPFYRIYEVSARIDHDTFVRKDKLEFDVGKIDAALDSLSIGELYPIWEFTQLDALPEVPGVRWTIYLLEHYLGFCSRKYKLLTRNFSKSGCSGLVVKKSSGISTFEEAVVKYCVENPVPTEKESLLDYLLQRGVIAARRYSNIDDLLKSIALY